MPLPSNDEGGRGNDAATGSKTGTETTGTKPSNRASGGASVSPAAANGEGEGSTQLRKSASVNKKKETWYATCCRSVVEHRIFVAWTTVLTVYALTGPDCQIMWTNKTADFYFNCMVLLCLSVFSIEVVLSVLGKEDYFLSFFFYLDVLSTGTLILDFSPVNDAMQGSSEDADGVKSLKSSKTAVVGAKTGRIVRVIRLVRIIKLYKAVHDAKARKKRMAEYAKDQPGVEDEDDWDDEELEEGDNKERKDPNSESRVGKKLSDITIRRVIILVLSLLLALPNMEPESEDQYAFSANYGADTVWRYFELWHQHQANPLKRKDYEFAMLRYVFFHNWFADRGFCNAVPKKSICANKYFNHVFWIGVMGPHNNDATVRKVASQANLTRSYLNEFLAFQHNRTNDIYVYGTMPEAAYEILTSPFSQACPYTSGSTNLVRYGVSLLSKEINDVIGYEVKCPDDLRLSETSKYYARVMNETQWQDNYYLVYYYDLRPFQRTDAGFNLLVTLFVVIVLMMAALMFTNDANELVLHPVSNMIHRIEAIRKDPLVAMKMADEEFRDELIKQAKKKREVQVCTSFHECKKMCARARKEPMETVVLEKTIIKLGSLLALGFGEAGAAIIGHNMKGSDTAGVNAMIPGRIVDCILGVARIRNFGTSNQVLQGSIMNFANQVAEIVHGVCNEYHGAANKNNGDSFMMIWRIDDKGQTRRMAELSCVAFAKVIGGLHHSPLLAEYRVHPGLQQRLGTSTRVNMNFGLHFGWAIEGGVGSEFKIDPSYLSPHVSLCLGIERNASNYGVPFILAESVFQLLGEQMQERVRLIDRVILTGSVDPMKLYSMDLDTDSVRVEANWTRPSWNARQRFMARQNIEREKRDKLDPKTNVVSLFDSDPNIVAMRKRYTVEFFQNFNMGYQNYCQGEWPVARRMLHTTSSMLGIEDGPSKALLLYMETEGYQSPKWWVPPGIRDLNQEKTRDRLMAPSIGTEHL